MNRREVRGKLSGGILGRAALVSLDSAIDTLAARSRIAAVCTVLAVDVFFLFMMVGFLPLAPGAPADRVVAFFLGLGTFVGLLLAAGPWMNAGFVRRLGVTLTGVPNVVVTRIRGFFIARLACEIRPANPAEPPLSLRFIGGLVGEYGSERPGLRLALAWALPADVIAFERWAYSDLPAVINDVEDLRRTLEGQEMVWTDLKVGRLESTVEPGWGRLLRQDETPDAFRERLMVRWRFMEAIRKNAVEELRFNPILMPANHGFPRRIASFEAALWCPSCGRRVRSADFEYERTCRRCGNQALYVFFREPWSSLGNAFSEKMNRVAGRYGLGRVLVP